MKNPPQLQPQPPGSCQLHQPQVMDWPGWQLQCRLQQQRQLGVGTGMGRAAPACCLLHHGPMCSPHAGMHPLAPHQMGARTMCISRHAWHR